ncbi:hypothetical protein [Nonomuraea sp. NPDC050643]|uniref:hypothetical protein n=1 Tax=Nonomuraea sp. NPDC050643 TaxID=3155660 RepID=UPI0033CE3D39
MKQETVSASVADFFGLAAATRLRGWLGGGRYVELDRVLGGGESGAKVACLYFEDRVGGDHQKFVVKLSRRRAEIERARQAWETAGAFQRHLAEMVDVIDVGDGSALAVQRVGGDDLGEFVPLSALELDTVAQTGARVVGTMLTRWRPGPASACADMSVRQFMTLMLGERVAEGGKVHRWATEQGLLHGRHPLGGPFTLLDPQGLGGRRLRGIHLGPAHRDLHLGNILVRRSPGLPREWILIDLDRFGPAAPRAGDGAHLLLCVLARELPALGEELRVALIEALAEGETAPGALPPQVVRLIRRFGEEWAGWLAGKGLGEEWAVHRRLALVAAALMFVGRARHQDDGTWLWFLRLAARVTGVLTEKWTARDATPREHRGPGGLAWERLRAELA